MKLSNNVLFRHSTIIIKLFLPQNVEIFLHTKKFTKHFLDMAAKRVSYKLEYIFRASPTIVYQFLTTPACLVRWFCDEVDILGNQYTFDWDGDKQIALLIEDWEDELLRFEWEDAPNPSEYLEFHISKSPITEETVMMITDYCDANEVSSAKKLWDSQINQMRVETGG